MYTPFKWTSVFTRGVMLIALSSGVLTALTACTTAQTGSNVGRADVRVAQEVVYGQILKLRTVRIDGSNTGQGSGAGLAVGGIAGATAGGSSSNQALSTIGGGLLGSIIGGGAEEKLTRSEGVEMVIKLDDGRTIAMIQEAGNDKFAVGQKVRIMSVNGYSRVVVDE